MTQYRTARRRERRERRTAEQNNNTYTQPFANIPPYTLFTEEQIDQVHEKSMQILEEGGIAFIYEPALEIFRKAGVKVDGDIVYIDRELVKESVAKAPSTFTWSARDPKKDVQIGGKAVCFAPVVGPPFVVDAEGGRREGTLHDLENFYKMTQMTPHLHCATSETCVPADIPIKHRHLDTMYANLTLGDSL